MSEELTGENAPAWTGGAFPYGEGWNEGKREAVRDRDNRECQYCGLSESEHFEQYGQKLHVHHIIPARQIDNPEKRNSKDNLEAVCLSCHMEVEQMAPLRPETGDVTAD
jgi:5-methylcytosine-specific restriction endonuclease McrA